MDIRDRILEAAKKIYALHGFRGATTRLIAIEAGVNEVTLFRTFGSKAALFEAVMSTHVANAPIPMLPDNPVDPEREMTEWVNAVLSHMRENRSLIRKSFGEIEDRPEAALIEPLAAREAMKHRAFQSKLVDCALEFIGGCGRIVGRQHGKACKAIRPCADELREPVVHALSERHGSGRLQMLGGG